MNLLDPILRVGKALYFSLLVSICASGALNAGSPVKQEKPIDAFDTDSLKVSGGNAWRWLSIPESRLVLNPFTKVADGVPPPAEGLALHLGYFYGTATTAGRLKNVISVGISPKTPVSHAWWPYKLEMSATDKDSGTQITTTDFLADENTVLRIMEFRSAGKGSATPIQEVSGQIHGKASWATPDILVADNGGWFTATCLADVGSIDELPSALLPISKKADSQWSAKIPTLKSGQAFLLASIGFATKAEGAGKAVERAKNAVLGKPAAQWLAERKQSWDALLAKVPHPDHFGVNTSGGVPPETHRQWYYGAWTFVLSQLLAPFPENNYPYFSIAEGKPSLWAEGDPAAPAQCSWTCFMVSGVLAEIMPDKAWSIYEGIMSRVNEEGILLGECLPSRKAQGGWDLYSATGDRERLSRVYPSIKRYLIWREKNPRWIWGTGEKRHDIPDEKDSSFVVSHLIDVDYAIKIAGALGLSEDVAFWQEMTVRELANYRKWFFPENGDPKNFYFTESGKYVFKSRTDQKPCYILSGLAFAGMPEDLADRLTQYYLKLRNPGKPLLGFEFMKYGESSFIAYGLFDRGMKSEGEQFIDRYLLDTMRPGGDFGETMEISKGSARVGGVSPSLFIALQAIDFTLMKNGARISKGHESGKALEAVTVNVP